VILEEEEALDFTRTIFLTAISASYPRLPPSHRTLPPPSTSHMKYSRAALLVLLIAALVYMISGSPNGSEVDRLGLEGYKLTVPANITRGVPFEVTYQYEPDQKERTYRE
jgi:hypothetical protein